MRKTTVLQIVAAFVGVGGMIAAGDGTGTIRGSVTAPAGQPVNVIVYINKIPGKTFPPPAEPVVLDQYKLTFVPHVLPILVGTSVIFPNHDEVPHNVFSPSPAKLFNLGSYPQGATRTVTFDKPGEVALLCNVHPEMSAYVLVLETPYFAVTDREGKFEIRDVPPGAYTLSTWHEKRRSVSAAVNVGVKEPATVRLRLK